MESPLTVLLQIASVLDALGVPYVVVGSFASSMRGLYRATADVDIVADIKPESVGPLVAALQGDFYVDELAVRRAIARRGSFNAIHFDAVFKVDIFVPPPGDFGRQQLLRRRAERITPDSAREIYVATAEDTILAKLLWYVAGGGVSETQWSDVRGVIGTQGGDLDVKYLREWAARLGVGDLLEKALESV